MPFDSQCGVMYNFSKILFDVTYCTYLFSRESRYCFQRVLTLCPPVDSIITLMTVWRITGKIIRTTIMLITYARV